MCLNSSRQHVWKYLFVGIIYVVFAPAHLSWLFVTPYSLWWELTEAWCLFSDWWHRHTHTCLTLCLSVFLFAGSLQSLFLIEFVPPAGAPGRGRHCQRLTVSYPAKNPTHICTRRRLILSVWALLRLFACFSLSVFCSWSGEVWSSAQKGDGTPSWNGEFSSVTYVCRTVWEEAEPT